MADEADTLDERRVVCVACKGSGLPPKDDTVNGTRCAWCDGKTWTTIADAVRWLRAAAGDEAVLDAVVCPACRGAGAPESSALEIVCCTACGGRGRVSSAVAVAILDRLSVAP